MTENWLSFIISIVLLMFVFILMGISVLKKIKNKQRYDRVCIRRRSFKLIEGEKIEKVRSRY